MNYYGPPRFIGGNVDEEVIEHFSPRQRVIMYLYYDEGWDQRQIGSILGFHQTFIGREINKMRYTSASLLLDYGVIKSMSSLVSSR